MWNLLSPWLAPLPALLGLALLGWATATARRNVGLVDILWSLFFLVAAGWHFASLEAPTVRAWTALGVALAWGLRLSGHLALRNWNAPEDRRYVAIRERNAPGFVFKSLYLVFGFQALLALLLSLPLAAAIRSTDPVLGPAGIAGAALVVAGLLYEAVADAQLAAFRRDPSNRRAVMDRGLWAHTRHPNYFGEAVVAWGFYLLAVDAGAAWTLFAPIGMTVLLMRYTGVGLLEQDIGTRRPGYAEYIARTNAFFPGPRRAG
ncbi:MAG: hypothetical protein RLZZ200_377 [Pseudomonadota bacterium]|jgi:steroid 5-alpha reductase family enzyme